MRQARVVERDVVLLPALAAEAEAQRGRRGRNSTWRLRSVVRPKELLVRAYSSLPTRISVSASSADHHRQHLLARQAGSARSCAQAPAQLRQRLAERDACGRTCRRRARAPLRVVAVLLALARVAAGGLQVAARVRQIQTSV